MHRRLSSLFAPALVLSLLTCTPAGARQASTGGPQPGPAVQHQSTHADARTALTEGVRTIAAPGSPGAIACWGERSHVIVVGDDGGRQVPVVAAAECGDGRVVLLAHSGYFDKGSLGVGETARLLTNAAHWAAGPERGAFKVGTVNAPGVLAALNAAGIDAVELAQDWPGGLGSIDVLILAGGLAEKDVSTVQKFIAGGGGFITAQCGWGWQQLAGGKSMLEFTINDAVAPAGLAFTDGFAGTTADHGFDATAVPGLYAHGGTALNAVLGSAEENTLSAVDRKSRAAASDAAMKALRVLPEDDRQFRPKIQALLATRSDQLAPNESHPLTENDHSLDRFLLAYQVDQLRLLPPESIKAHPAAASFPGEVAADAPWVSRTVEIDTSVPEWHSLGLHARAGDVVRVSVPGSAAGAGLSVRIGCHTDELWHHGVWKRVPQIWRAFAITSASTSIASPFGGLVYLDVPRGCKLGTISVTIEGAVEAPLFVLGKTDPAAWKETIRHAPSPWAELATSKVIVTVPSERIRDLEDPTPVCEFWDKVLDAAADLATIPRERRRPERYVADVQISAGYMHSGYPIMTHLDAGAWLPSLAELKSGNWGLYHELGHNHQKGEWTFDGTGEVTCNLFCLYIHDTLCEGGKTDSKRWLAERQDDVAKYLARGAPFDRWKAEPFTALAMYIQLQQAFGWETFKKVFAEYRDLPRDQRPQSDDQKRDQWMVRFSKACGRNLGPFFQAWGVPTSDAARAEIVALPAWMPEDWPGK
ncbi:MAG: hypothetical protein GIKADHBN_00063 [Phycisphaerales bacterium]|nr:hypothetical protein [Phycisphaerales bacterium]